MEDVARQTRIARRFLEAIEAEQFDRLPGLVFTRNFVRQYAEFLNLDPEPLLGKIPKVDIESTPMPHPPARVRRATWDPHWSSALSTAMWCVAAVGAGAGGYWYFEHPIQFTGFGNRHAQSPLPPRKVEAASVPAPAASMVPAAAPDVAPNTAEPAPPTEIARAAEGAAIDPTRPVQVILTAKEVTWVQITADGKTEFTGTLRPNDSRAVAANTLVKVIAGNAGGVQISLNGRALEAIGPSGQVRTVRLTADGAELGARPQPAAVNPL